ELHKPLNQLGVQPCARGKHIERQLLALVPAKNNLVSPRSHHLPPAINSRALKRDSAASFSKSSFSLGVSLGGMTILIFTYSSPRPPLRLFNPCPRNLSFLPPCVPAGIFISTDPSSVSTLTFVPSAASHGATGSSI